MEILIEIAKVSGPVGISIIALIMIVKMFLKAMDDRDKRNSELISNHLNHNTGAMNDLKIVIRELCIWLKRSNGK